MSRPGILRWRVAGEDIARDITRVWLVGLLDGLHLDDQNVPLGRGVDPRKDFLEEFFAIALIRLSRLLGALLNFNKQNAADDTAAFLS